MNILIYDREEVHLDQLKHIMDVVRSVSGSDAWLALPKGIDVIQNAPVEYLIHYREMLDEQIKKYQEVDSERP
jgi:hypothetical protein